jgi:chromosome segregation ATPase
VAGLLDEDYTSESVLSAVETALEVVASTTRPDVRFHEDTALLIVSGDHDQLEAIEQVLDRLNESVARRREDLMRQLELQFKEIDHDRQDARKRLAEASIETKNAREEIAALREKIAHLEMMSTEQRRMLEQKDRELTATVADLRALQIELQHERERSRREPGRSNPGD